MDCDFELALYTDARELLRAYVTPDWIDRLVSDARFSASRAGAIPCEETSFTVCMRPTWCKVAGREARPAVSHVTIELCGQTTQAGFSKRYFYQSFLAPLAQRLSSAAVSARLLAPGDSYVYLLLARGEAALDPQPTDLPLSAQRRERPSADVWPNMDAADFPVYVDDRVIRDLRAHAASDREREVGGFLLGILGQAPADPELFLEVTGFVPAHYVESTLASVKLKAESWAEAMDEAVRRGLGESVVGWAHSHTFGGARSPNADCGHTSDNLFLSTQDVFIHETMFAFPHALALVVDARRGITAQDMPVALFGWRDGILAHREFQSLRPAHDASPAAGGRQ
jgi:proteasome lid subunit RPN8/RPN11